jgi:DNA-binding NarL/FixJ family response regulator
MKQPDPYKIAIADSQFLITQSLISLIQNSDKYSLIGLVDTINDLNNLLMSNEIDLLITDFNLVDYNGFHSLKGITLQYPKIHILILTNQTNRNEINEFAKIGIKNIIYKTADQEEIFRAIDFSLRNKKYYSDEVLDLLMINNPANNLFQESLYLTPTEINIVKLITSGLTTKEIASQSNISFHTVMSHRKNIFRKLGINSASELIMYAVRSGLIENIEYHI